MGQIGAPRFWHLNQVLNEAVKVGGNAILHSRFAEFETISPNAIPNLLQHSVNN